MDRIKKNIIELTHISLEEYKGKEKIPLILLADNVRSAQNIGAMLRTSDAFLLREVIMGGISPAPPSAEISKTSLGAEESVCWRHVDDAYAEALRLREAGMFILSLEQTHNSLPLQDFPKAFSREELFARGCVLVVGNEVKGVDQRIIDISEASLEIPMNGIKHSLNVSVSAGIALWEIYKYIKVQ